MTRNQSLTVKTLHTVLKINIRCLELGWFHEISFVNDTEAERTEMLNKKLRDCDKYLWLDYSISMDHASIEQIFKCTNTVIFPCVVPVVDWGLFKHKVLENTDEPVSQVGLQFDTEVTKPTKDLVGHYNVKKTVPSCFMLDQKDVSRVLKQKNGPSLKLSGNTEKLFETLLGKNVKMTAFVDAEIGKTATHECHGHILYAAGIKSV